MERTQTQSEKCFYEIGTAAFLGGKRRSCCGDRNFMNALQEKYGDTLTPEYAAEIISVTEAWTDGQDKANHKSAS